MPTATSSSSAKLIAVKTIIVLIALTIIATQWNWKNDTGGNFGLAIGVGMMCLPVLIILDILSLKKHQKPRQIVLIVLSIIFDVVLLMLLPEIMKLLR